jgi:hypothetical protein
MLAAELSDPVSDANGATACRGTGSPLPVDVTLKSSIEAVERKVLRETLLRHD